MVYERVYLLASGDLRESANQVCWPAQQAMEAALGAAVAKLGSTVVRAHGVDAARGHGFLASQREGMDAFRDIPVDAPVIVAEAVWQYSHHVLPGLIHHKGPVLTVANWEGQWPGLVGMLNLNGSLTKAGRAYSTLWSLDFTDAYFLDGLKTWLEGGTITHDQSHVTPSFADIAIPAELEADCRRHRRRHDPDQTDHGRVRRGLHGHVQRHRARPSAQPAGHLQGAPVAVGALLRDERRFPTIMPTRRPRWLESKGMTFAFRQRRGDELTRGAGTGAIEDVCRRGADGRPVLLRCHRHPVPAGSQGPVAGLRSGRGPAEQRRPSRSAQKRRRETRSVRARRSPISTRSTNAPALTAC